MRNHLLYVMSILLLGSSICTAAERWSPSLADRPVADEPAFWLVREGAPAATIVIAAEPLIYNQQAAELLQASLETMSGARLPIVDDSQAVEGPVVLIGRSRLTEALNMEFPSGFSKALTEEGYVIRTMADKLVLVGNDHQPTPPYKGSYFATAELLQRLGCRWFFPGEIGELIPRSANVNLPNLNELSRPDLAVRGFWWGSSPERRRNEEVVGMMDAWMQRNRYLPYGTVLASAGDGSIMAPFRKYRYERVDGKRIRHNETFEEHPEYFALKADGSRNEHYLCLSEPEVLRIATEFMLNYFRENPHVPSYGMAPPDGAPTCECAPCIARNGRFLQKDPSGLGIQDISDGFYWFLNEVAKQVKVEFPDRWVTTTAYSGRIRPPENVDLEDNISLHTALLGHSRHHRYDAPTWHTKERVQIYKRWAAISDFVVEREYYPVFQFSCSVPQQMYRSSAWNIRFIKELGLRGCEWEGRLSFMSEGLNNYVRGHVLWNTDTDMDALLTDFYTRYYGAAGPVVQAYDEVLEDALINAPVDHHEEERIPEIYPYEVVVQATEAVGDVAALVADADPAIREHVRIFQLRVEHFRAYSEMRQIETELQFAKAAELASRMIEIESEMDAINPTFIDLNLERFDTRAVYGELGANASAHGKLKQYVAKQRMIDGTDGELVTALPLTWSFRTDPHDEGVVFQWYDAAVTADAWRPMKTTASWEIQGMQDEEARGYDGFAWYRTTFEMPARQDERRLILFLGGYNNQAWIWINGRFAASTPFHEYWMRWKYHEQIDLTDFLEPGKTNHIAIRLWNDQGAGGLFRRSFIYAQNAQ